MTTSIISRDRKLSPSTLNKHLVVIRKVLNEARRRGYLKALPAFSTIKRKDNPRPYFTDTEYRKLWRAAAKLAKQKVKVRYVPLTDEIWDFIVFHVNVFVRVSDLKTLKHRHVQVVKENGTQYLLLSVTKSKTVNRDSATMPFAVDVYERLLQRVIGRVVSANQTTTCFSLSTRTESMHFKPLGGSSSSFWSMQV